MALSKEEKKQRKQNATNVASEAILSTVGGSTFVLRLIAGIAWLAGHKEFKNPTALIAVTLVLFSALSSLDAYVHYKIFQRYNKIEDKEHQHLTAGSCKSSAQTSPLKFYAFICALSCGINRASMPVVVITLLRTVFDLKISAGLQVTELVLSTATTILSIWNAPSNHSLSLENLSNPQKKATSCCGDHA